MRFVEFYLATEDEGEGGWRKKIAFNREYIVYVRPKIGNPNDRTAIHLMGGEVWWVQHSYDDVLKLLVN